MPSNTTWSPNTPMNTTGSSPYVSGNALIDKNLQQKLRHLNQPNANNIQQNVKNINAAGFLLS